MSIIARYSDLLSCFLIMQVLATRPVRLLTQPAEDSLRRVKDLIISH